MIQSNPLAILNKEKMLADLMMEEIKLNEEIITLRRLLAETADQLRLHDQEYKHQTPQELKDRLRDALEGKNFCLPKQLGGEWKEPENPTYRCEVHLIPEVEGGFSVLVPNLPGCGSQGETIDEALANIKEALEGVIECYLERDGKVPWIEVSEAPQPGTIVKRVIVEIKK